MSNSTAHSLRKNPSPTSIVVPLLRLATSIKSEVIRNRFLACLTFIVCVSIYDSYLVVLYRDSILDDERNPICKLLIRQDPYQLSWFLLGKALGNVVVVGTLIALKRFGYRANMTIATSIALFQFCLLLYLNFSDRMTGFLHFDGLCSHEPERFQEGLNSVVVHGVALIGILMVGIVTRTSWRST